MFLGDPGAARDDRTLPLRQASLYRDRYGAAGEASAPRAVVPREEPTPAGARSRHRTRLNKRVQIDAPVGSRCLLGKIELASLADREVRYAWRDVVGGCRLIRVREIAASDRKRFRASPIPPCTDGRPKMRVQADKPPRVRQTVEDAAHAIDLPRRPREFGRRRWSSTSEITKSANADRVEPGTRIEKEVARGDAKDETPPG